MDKDRIMLTHGSPEPLGRTLCSYRFLPCSSQEGSLRKRTLGTGLQEDPGTPVGLRTSSLANCQRAMAAKNRETQLGINNYPFAIPTYPSDIVLLDKSASFLHWWIHRVLFVFPICEALSSVIWFVSELSVSWEVRCVSFCFLFFFLFVFFLLGGEGGMWGMAASSASYSKASWGPLAKSQG